MNKEPPHTYIPHNPYTRWLYIMDLHETLGLVSTNKYFDEPLNYKKFHIEYYQQEKKYE